MKKYLQIFSSNKLQIKNHCKWMFIYLDTLNTEKKKIQNTYHYKLSLGHSDLLLWHSALYKFSRPSSSNSWLYGFVGLITFEISFWHRVKFQGTLSCMMIFSSFCRFFVVMDGISANDLFQASVFSKGYNRKRGKSFFTTLICL